MPPPRRSAAPLGAPLFVLNLKTYPQTVGRSALRFARMLSEAGAELGVAVAIAPAASELGAVARAVRIPTLAQHVDPDGPGPATGFVPVRAAVAAGAAGSLVNHSEHPLAFEEVSAVLRELGRARLPAVVCAPTPAACRRLASLGPAYLAIEPPELIGGSRAVSTARPEVVRAGVRATHAVSPRTRVLCGAGIRHRDDVRRALELGAEGVLVASSVALAPRPGPMLRELLRGF